MWRSYFTIALRNLFKHRHYSIINILGLAIGISSFIIIWMYIYDELSFDKHHHNADNTYRLINVYDFGGVGENSASCPFPVAWTLMDEYPQYIKNTVRIFNMQTPRFLIQHGDKKFTERRFFFADSTYFSIFNHNFIYGDPQTALSEINSVVISESTANKYFGDENPVGKTIRLENWTDLKISGVIKNVPHNSHFKFDLLASMSTCRNLYRGQLPKTWVWNPCWTYLALEEGAAPKLEEKFPSFIEKYFYDAEKENISMYLQPLTDIHLRSKLDYEIAPNSNIKYINILKAIATFLLIIAIINYVNLSTATSSTRSKEIGLKKVFGVTRRQLIVQFVFESLLLSIIASIAAMLIIEFMLPVLNTFANKNIISNVFVRPGYLIFVILVSVCTGFIAGFYPAIYLSVFNPIQALNKKQNQSVKSGNARKILVVTQFTISIILIIVTINIFNQINYLKTTNTGITKKNILIIPVSGTEIARSYQSFKDELLTSPEILSITNMDDIPGVAHNTHEFRTEGIADDKWNFYPAMVINYDFLKTFDIRIVAGRDYSEEMKTDPEKGILINEAMVKHMSWPDNEYALGQKFRSLNGNERVIGVFKNFNTTSLHVPSGPFVLNMKETPYEVIYFTKYVAIKTTGNNNNDVISFIEETWQKYDKLHQFEYTWFENEIKGLYHDEEVLGTLSMILSIIIIFIALLGLFGLATFMTEQRNKEIGIRKVFGAERRSIIVLLTTEFTGLLLIAVVFAWLLSYWFIDEWLRYFAYQTSINWPSFIYGATIAFFMAMVIIFFRAFIASRTNPIDTIKYE